MDSKALAKSKRAHTIRNTKNHHHHQASKSPSPIGSDKTPAGKQIQENPKKSHGSKSLPTNWSRYDEELDEESTNQPSEFILPKSKGADYTYLVSEAKAQQQVDYSSDSFPLFGDALEDFNQGFGQMLSAKGESILSWIAEDDFDFDFEDKATTSHEAPFLSLNLQVVAEQLAKAELRERLFLDPNDLLPPELLSDELQTCGEDEHNQIQIESETSSLSLDTEENNPAATTSKNELNSINQIEDEFWKIQEIDQDLNLKSISEDDSGARKPATFKASNVEAELDMLLDSFSETNILEQIPTGSPIALPAEFVKKGTHKTMNSVDINDVINKQTSVLVYSNSSTSNMGPSSKSKLVDDFDSWLDTI